MKPGYESQNILASALRCDSIPHSCINVEILIFRESPLFCFTLHYLWGWISRWLSVSWSTDEISGSCWWGRKPHSRHWSHLRAYLRLVLGQSDFFEWGSPASLSVSISNTLGGGEIPVVPHPYFTLSTDHQPPLLNSLLTTLTTVVFFFVYN